MARITASDGNLVSALQDNNCLAIPHVAPCPYINNEEDLNTIINSNRVFINDLAAISDVNCNGRNDFDLFNIVSINAIFLQNYNYQSYASLETSTL